MDCSVRQDSRAIVFQFSRFGRVHPCRAGSFIPYRGDPSEEERSRRAKQIFADGGVFSRSTRKEGPLNLAEDDDREIQKDFASGQKNKSLSWAWSPRKADTRGGGCCWERTTDVLVGEEYERKSHDAGLRRGKYFQPVL